MPNTQTAGSFLAQVLKENGKTTSDVTRQTGLSPGAVRRALRDEGQRSRQTVQKLAAASEMTPDQAARYAELAGYPPAVLRHGADWRKSIIYLTMLIEALAGPAVVQQVQSTYQKMEPAAVAPQHHPGRRLPAARKAS